jgi:hypothetical protein
MVSLGGGVVFNFKIYNTKFNSNISPWPLEPDLSFHVKTHSIPFF